MKKETIKKKATKKKATKKKTTKKKVENRGAKKRLKPEDVQTRIKKYFASAKRKKEPYTVTGLAYYIGLTRKQLIEYAKDAQYYEAITEAKSFIEYQNEVRLLSDNTRNVTGVMFNLKANFKWEDAVKVNSDVNMNGNMNVNVSAEQFLKDEEIKF